MHRYFLKIMYFFVSIVFILLTYCTKATEVDNKPPEVVITYPENGAVISEPIFINAQVTDNEGVKKVDFYIDSLLISSDVEPEYEAYFNPYFYSDGNEHIILVKAEDINGNVSLPAEINITVPEDLENFPELIEPENNEFIFNDNLVNFKWKSFTDASTYNLVVSLDSGFNNIIHDITLDDTLYIYEPEKNSRFFWKIRAFDQYGNPSNWSITNSFYYDSIITFSKAYNTDLNSWLCSAYQLENGDIISIGNESFALDIYRTIFLKTDKYGNEFLRIIYDDTWCVSYDMIITQDGNIMLAGYDRNDDDMCIVKIDRLGNVLWVKSFPDDVDARCKNIVQTDDGGFVLLGNRYYSFNFMQSIWLMKIDSNGNFVWEYYMEHGYQKAYDLLLTENGDLIIASEYKTSDTGHEKLKIRKFDINGNQLWFNIFYNSDDFVLSGNIVETNLGYLIVGNMSSYHTYFVQVDENGEIIDQHIYDNDNNLSIYSVIKTSDNSFILTGRTDTGWYEDSKLWIAKSDVSGKIIWERNYQYNKEQGMGFGLASCYDGGYVVSGRSFGNAQLWLLKTDEYGNLKPKFK